MRWQATTTLTPLSLVFSAIVTSFLFMLLHGPQVGYQWGPMLVLFSISLVLTFVRVKTQSVAASTLVHISYNSFLFLVMIIATGGYRHMDRVAH
jgi:membrane protease YdiL (CAAX protease family)